MAGQCWKLAGGLGRADHLRALQSSSWWKAEEGVLWTVVELLQNLRDTDGLRLVMSGEAGEVTAEPT